MNKSDPNEYEQKIAKLLPDIELLGAYTSAREKIPVRCKQCGHEWMAWPQALEGGHGCKICNRKRAIETKKVTQTKTTKIRLKEAKEKFPRVDILDTILTTNELFEAKCQICGNKWTTTLGRIVKTRGCPKCNRQSTSLPEQMIYVACKAAFPQKTVLNENRVTIGSELDILIPELNKAIEYGAWYWHCRRTERDIEKENLCKKHGIELLTIYESTGNAKINTVNNCLTYSDSIQKFDDLVEIAKTAIAFFDQNTNISTLNWEDIYEEAISRTGHEALEKLFKERMEKDHPEIKIRGKYRRYCEPIEVECLKCGNIWKTKPVNLLEGHGCPQCARIAQSERQLKTTEDFAKELKALNPNLQLIGKYTHSRSNVKIRCSNCGCTWTARADYVLADHRCPSCETATKRKGVLKQSTQGHIKKQEKLNTKIAKLDKNIEIIGTITSDDQPVACRCKKCKTVFERSPKDLRRHPHCPKCNGHFRYTPETFRERMEEINPNIEVVGDFKKQAEKLECRCKICDHRWMVTPNKLLQGRGCPKCAAKERSAAGVAARKKKKEAESKDSA